MIRNLQYMHLTCLREMTGQRHTGLANNVTTSLDLTNATTLHRLLSRLLMDSCPSLALKYATHAEELGDIGGASVHASILDMPSSHASTHTSATRARLISQLISKLDSPFAYHVSMSEKLKNSGFISFITG